MPEHSEAPNRRILLVDDNPAIHQDFRKIFEPAPHSATVLKQSAAGLFGRPANAVVCPVFQLDSAFQGEEGLERVRQARLENQPYAMAFVDMRMPPGWDGIETIRHVWEHDPDIQIVVCTAYSDYSWEEILNKLGRADRLIILQKPFDNAEVLQLANSLTEKWRLARQAREHLKRLIANISREIRIPLSDVTGMTDLLLATPLDSTQRNYAETIRDSAAALLTAINDVLDCPRANASYDSIAPRNPAHGPPGPEKRRILLAEDHPMNRKVVCLVLEWLGYDVDAVNDGHAAIAAWETGQYDLILLDCRMPGLSGYETAREIRHREQGARHIPIVALTAHAMAGAEIECKAAGMDDYIPKPVDRKRLEDCLKRLLTPSRSIP